VKLYQRLVLFTLVATTVPVSIGFVVLRQNEKALERRMLAESQETASRLSELVAREIRELLDRIQTAIGFVSIDEMSNEEMSGWLRILYKQREDIAQVALIDEHGIEIHEGVFLEKPEEFHEYAGRRGVSAEAHRKFVSDLNINKIRDVPLGSVLVDPPVLSGNKYLGFPISIPLGLSTRHERFILSMEVSLDRVARVLKDSSSSQGWSLLLVDDHSRRILQTDPKDNQPLVSLVENPAVKRLADGSSNQGAFYDQEALVAYSKIPVLNWGIVTTQSRNEALSEVRRVRRITLAWTAVSIAFLLLLGGLFTGRITTNLKKFIAGAKEYSRGNLEKRIDLGGSDELGMLATTFNQMGEDLRISRAEIERWNKELAQRVEERTKELELAHRRLLEASKLAAVGQLSAGIAHEINNPLVGILGNVQLLLLKMKSDGDDGNILRKVESAAKRCKEIIQNLQRFSEPEEDIEHAECGIQSILTDAYSMIEQRMKDGGIETYWELPQEPVSYYGSSKQLVHVFFNLFSNAKNAMPSGGKLRVSLKKHPSMLEVSVSDTGKGIAPEHLDRIYEPFFTTKDEWTNIGLGLSVAYRVVADHGGRIEVESKLGQGSHFRILLPLVKEHD
jgi:two-component system, NtrC family, sensor kinase